MHEEILIPFGVFAFVTVIVTVVTLTKQAGRKRELEHKERMRAIEMGMPIPGHYPWPAMAAIAIGAVVPVAAFVFAYLTNLIGPGSDLAWIFAGLVGATAVLCGTFLAAAMLRHSRESSTAWDTPTDDWRSAKPVVDPDAYDTVGQRG